MGASSNTSDWISISVSVSAGDIIFGSDIRFPLNPRLTEESPRSRRRSAHCWLGLNAGLYPQNLNGLPLAGGMRAALLVQYHGQQGLIDLDFPVVFDEAQLSEFVHEEIHTRTRRSDHARQRLLRNLRQGANGLVLFSIAREQQQRARQPLFAGVEKLINEILFDPDVMRQHIPDEMVR